MKKIAYLALIFLIIVASIFGIYIHFTYKSPEVSDNLALQAAIQANIKSTYTWFDIYKKDLNGYLNGTTTNTVEKIIKSLEEATPVIIQTTNEKFGNSNNATFIVASAFDTSNQVYTYVYDSASGKYNKKLYTLESLLEDAISVYMYAGTEEIQWKKYTISFFPSYL